MTEPEQVRQARQLLHEVWLAVHVRRFDKTDGATGKPDSFYAGVIHSEHAIGEVAARHGVDYHALRASSVGSVPEGTEKT